jgi:hypothetical protein
MQAPQGFTRHPRYRWARTGTTSAPQEGFLQEPVPRSLGHRLGCLNTDLAAIAKNFWWRVVILLRGPLAAILPLFPLHLQLPSPLGLNLPGPDKRDYRNVASLPPTREIPHSDKPTSRDLAVVHGDRPQTYNRETVVVVAQPNVYCQPARKAKWKFPLRAASQSCALDPAGTTLRGLLDSG